MKILITIFSFSILFFCQVIYAQQELPNKCDCKLFFNNYGKPGMFDAAKKVLNDNIVEKKDKSFKNTRKAERICTEIAKNEMNSKQLNNNNFSDVLQYYYQYDCDLKDVYSFSYFQLGFWFVFNLLIIIFVKYPYKLLVGLMATIFGLCMLGNILDIKNGLGLSNFMAVMYMISFPLILVTSAGAWADSSGNVKKGIRLGFGVCPNCYKKVSYLASKCPYCTSDLN